MRIKLLIISLFFISTNVIADTCDCKKTNQEIAKLMSDADIVVEGRCINIEFLQETSEWSDPDSNNIRHSGFRFISKYTIHISSLYKGKLSDSIVHVYVLRSPTLYGNTCDLYLTKGDRYIIFANKKSFISNPKRLFKDKNVLATFDADRAYYSGKCQGTMPYKRRVARKLK